MKRYIDHHGIRETIRRRFHWLFAGPTEPPRLLEDGTLGILVEELADKYPEADVREWFRHWTRQGGYVAATRRGGPTYSCDVFGVPSGWAEPEG
jgi:hypothetical protein